MTGVCACMCHVRTHTQSQDCVGTLRKLKVGHTTSGLAHIFRAPKLCNTTSRLQREGGRKEGGGGGGGGGRGGRGGGGGGGGRGEGGAFTLNQMKVNKKHITKFLKGSIIRNFAPMKISCYTVLHWFY